MPGFGHVAVGLAAGRLHVGRQASSRRLLWAMAGFVALSLLPDADVLAFVFRIPYRAEFGHRGASHSIAAALAVALGVFGWARWRRAKPLRLTLLTFAVAVSHPLLDTMTDGGLGCALFWPFSQERIFASFRPIPVSPIGARLASERGLRVLTTELLLFAPFWLYALWPRPRPS